MGWHGNRSVWLRVTIKMAVTMGEMIKNRAHFCVCACVGELNWVTFVIMPARSSLATYVSQFAFFT